MRVQCERCGEVKPRIYTVLVTIVMCERCAVAVLPAMCDIMYKKGMFNNGKFPIDFVDAEGDELDLH